MHLNGASYGKLLQQAESADDYYNLGTTLAASGEFELALDALEHALALYGNPATPGFANAFANRSLVLQWLEQEQQKATSEASSDRDTNSNAQDETSNESDVEGEDSDSAGTSAEQPTVGGTVGAGNTLEQTALEQQGISGRQQDSAEDDLRESPTDATAVAEDGAINTAENQDGFDADSGAAAIDELNSNVLNPYSEQWLRNLPQDPGGYMRRKFQYQSQIRQQSQPAESVSKQNDLDIERGRY